MRHGSLIGVADKKVIVIDGSTCDEHLMHLTDTGKWLKSLTQIGDARLVQVYGTIISCD